VRTARRLLLLSAISAAFCRFGWCEPIVKVEIRGNARISEHRILLLLKSRPGADFSETVLRDDTRRLAESGLFSTVSSSFQRTEQGVVVRFTVVEQQVISSVSIKGLRRMKEKEARSLLGFAAGDTYDPARCAAGARALEDALQEKGLPLASVRSEASPAQDGLAVTVIVEEGPKAGIIDISFEGVTAFSVSTLKKQMKTRERRALFFRGTLKKHVLEEDCAALQRFYRQRGYLDMQVTKTSITPQKKGVCITLTISEGPAYTLGKVTFTGSLLVPEDTLRGLLSLTREGTVFDGVAAEKDLAALRSFYFNRGHIRAIVEQIPSPGDRPDRINLTYSVAPGDVYTVGAVTIKGNTRTKDKVIRREVALSPGDIFSGAGLTKSFTNLRDLNYFEGISISPEATAETGIADIAVTVQERERTGIMSFGGGYSSVDGPVGFFSIEQTNFDITNPWHFVGGGQNMKFWVQLGSEQTSYSLSFTEPYFRDRPVWLGVDLFKYKRDWTDYDEDRAGGGLRIGRRWDRWSLGFSPVLEEISITDVVPPSLTAGTWREHSLTTRLGYRSLDSRRHPTEGWDTSLELKYAGGLLAGDLDFVRLTLEADYYHRLTEKLVLHSHTLLGTATEMGDTPEVPFFEKFYGGGIGTVRGYKERTLGPRDPVTGSAIGGNAIVAQNLELIYPLYEDILKGLVFFDIGNVWDSWSDRGEFKKGVGLGVRFAVPFLSLPIDIQYGFALDAEPGEDSRRLHIGMTFAF